MLDALSLLLLSTIPLAAESAAPGASSGRVAIAPTAPVARGGGTQAATTDDWKPIESLPFTITSPGGYYLPASLTGAANLDGITIVASDVVIDLNGFELVGVPGSRDGILTGVSAKRVQVRRGSVRGWGGDGIDFTTTENSLVADVRATGNVGFGVHLGTESSVSDCNAFGNGGTGILVGFAGRIERSLASRNGDDGIQIGERGLITACYASDNTGDGIQGNIVLVSGCQANDNDGHGFFLLANSQISACTAYRNAGDGIRLGADCTARENLCTQNGVGGAIGAGIRVTANFCRVEANQVQQNDSGIQVDATVNLVIRNTSVQNAGGLNYVIVAGNTVGPIVTSATIATSTNPHANYTM